MMSFLQWPFARWMGGLLNMSEVEQIDRWHLSFGAEWVRQWPALLILGLLLFAGLSWFWYARLQGKVAAVRRLILTSLRAAALMLLLVILADPILELQFISQPKPWLWLVLDGSESMSIADALPPETRDRLDKAASTATNPVATDTAQPTRAEYIRRVLTAQSDTVLKTLADRYRVRLFSMEDGQGVRSLDHPATDESGNNGSENGSRSTNRRATDEAVNWPETLKAWQPNGIVSAHGNALEDLSRRQSTDHLAGVVFVSDFDQNAGQTVSRPAKKLGVPIFTVGVGLASARDVSVDLTVPPTMKKAEGSTVLVTLRQHEYEGETVNVRLFAEPVGDSTKRRLIEERSINLQRETIPLEFDMTPDEAGRFALTAEVDPLPSETITENNTVSREVTIIDDFLRLMYVEYEPTWEWRFIKEVFYRDRLVGTRGFRTFLRSADPLVRENNELFLPTATLPRNEFFATDVIFLGDVPSSALTSRFCEMAREFVGQFGGGMVVIAGPRFGPSALAETPLADMLPVVVDADAKLQDKQEYILHLPPVALQFDFMRLGPLEGSMPAGWNNLGPLPWYQPVSRVEALSTTVLAEHPTALCADGKTHQPLIAIRKYGRGEVVYVGFNEMWRLRKLYGEKYYRQFWGQLIHRLGLSHALGNQKRFVVRSDKPQYRSDDSVLITVEAYDQNFQPLAPTDLARGRLTGELVRADRGSRGIVEPISLTAVRPGLYEARLKGLPGGDYQVKVSDPIANEPVATPFQVAAGSAERRSAVRNVALETLLARETGGHSYELDQLPQLVKDLPEPRFKSSRTAVFSLWDTWLTFGTLVLLLMAEWMVRKLVHLS